ncbi:hypothetical protein QSY_0902 [Clostridioides difficile P36]|nr:hypothetical protein QSY_0902 [Clostridioides difficile P36]
MFFIKPLIAGLKLVSVMIDISKLQRRKVIILRSLVFISV